MRQVECTVSHPPSLLNEAKDKGLLAPFVVRPKQLEVIGRHTRRRRGMMMMAAVVTVS